MPARIVAVVALSIATPLAIAGAQLVTPKTVPVHQGQQFDVLPSTRPGMAGVSIAVDDSLLDPFINPARAARLRQAAVFSTPFSHSVSGDRGGGRTLPIGGTAPFGEWTLTGVFAVQQLDRAGPMRFSPAISGRSAMNQYVATSLGRRLGNGVAIGASASWASLGAVDGVDLLYAGSDNIDQSGAYTDLRAGITKAWAGDRSFEFLVLHNRFQMTHDVHFTTFRWDSARRTMLRQTRTDNNDDQTNAWGAHARYVQPVGTEGWRVGWIATVNRLVHPKIPNYQLMSIPRDPGTTVGMNAGIGLARVFGATTFGADLIYEPMRSDTWADAAKDTAVTGRDTVRAGAKTIENNFKFSNAIMRVGLSHEIAVGPKKDQTVGLQLGLGLYSINYRLGQVNHVRDSSRVQREGWTEWTRTLGLHYRTRDVLVQYSYSMTCTGSCSTEPPVGRWFVPSTLSSAAAGSLLAAPSSPLTFNGGTASAHKFTVVLPIR